MAYEVLYWNMPVCKAQCANKKVGSFSCVSADFSVAEDAVWPGNTGDKDNNLPPDIIPQHVKNRPNSDLDSDSADLDIGKEENVFQKVFMLRVLLSLDLQNKSR